VFDKVVALHDCKILAGLMDDSLGVTSAPWWIVPSVIQPVKDPLSYTLTRSVFTAEQRLDQTLMTLSSIRRISDAPILLTEMSCFRRWENLTSAYGNISVVYPRLASQIGIASTSPQKGLAEALVLIAAGQRQTSTAGYWKLSGRYSLSVDWPTRMNLDRGIMGNYGPEVLNTVCFGVAAQDAVAVTNGLIGELDALAKGKSIEAALTDCADNLGLRNPRSLPAEGYVAVNGDYFIVGR
jgi:hypothetical protein